MNNINMVLTQVKKEECVIYFRNIGKGVQKLIPIIFLASIYTR